MEMSKAALGLAFACLLGPAAAFVAGPSVPMRRCVCRRLPNVRARARARVCRAPTAYARVPGDVGRRPVKV